MRVDLSKHGIIVYGKGFLKKRNVFTVQVIINEINKSFFIKAYVEHEIISIPIAQNVQINGINYLV